MPITRTITLDDPTPAELAAAFCDLDGDDQAAFLSAVWRIAKEWPGAGWCQQSYAIMQASDRDTRETIRVLASHLPAEDFAYVAAAQEQSNEA